MCGVRRKSALSGMSYLQYKERSVLYIEGHTCSTSRKLCSVRRVCSIRTATSAVGGEGVWCEEKVCSISMAHLWYK